MDKPEEKERLLSNIRESGLLEECVAFVKQGKDTRPLFQEFFQIMGEDYLDEYEAIGNMAEAVALKKIDAYSKDN